jgi:hypothetical protein
VSESSKREKAASLVAPFDNMPFPQRRLGGLDNPRIQSAQAGGNGAQGSVRSDAQAPALADHAAGHENKAAHSPVVEAGGSNIVTGQSSRLKTRQRKKLHSIESGTMVKTTLEFDKHLYALLKQACLDQRRTMVDMTEEAIRMLLDRMGYRLEN